MRKAIADLLPRVLAFSATERAELAAELLASLHGEPETEVEQAWAAEIDRRILRLRAGEAKGRPWSDVYSELRRPRE